MRDQWYGDNRDLVKWAVLVALAKKFQATSILQMLYLTPSVSQQIEIDGERVPVPAEVLNHFRNVRAISDMNCGVKIETFSEHFAERVAYHDALIKMLRTRGSNPEIVFLDPDTGLEPEGGNYGPTHVRSAEVNEIWKSLRSGEVLVFYQHQNNRAGREWIEPKRLQLAGALGLADLNATALKVAHGPEIAPDVAFYFICKE